jgi:hypothetical protein
MEQEKTQVGHETQDIDHRLADNFVPRKAIRESWRARNPPPLPDPKPPDALENPLDPYSQSRVIRRDPDYIDTDSIGGD